jgi:D-alanyl-D-alanine carboxypeptidase
MKKVLLFSLLFLSFFNTCYASTSSASSYVLMDQTTGRVLKEKNMNSPRLIASITKIMTCLLAVESGKLDDVVVVDESINDAYGSGIYIKVGEEMTLRDLLYGLMLRSGNDAALMVASYVGGSVSEFVELMNKKAKEIGMKNTVFVNPSGLDNTDSGNYSSSYDMALLTRYAMNYDDYKKIVGTESYTLKTNMNTYKWINKNKLLRRYDYITGGKTGYTEKAHRTLVTTASYNNMDLIVVTLNDSDDWNTHTELYNYAFDNYVAYKVLSKDRIDVIGDTYYNGDFYVKDDVYIPLLKSEKGNLVSHIKLDKLNNYNSGDIVGIDSIYLGKDLLYQDNIYIRKNNNKEDKISFWERIREIFK